MLKRRIEIPIHLLNIIFISSFLVVYINRDFPLVGHDYRYFIPMILDTYLHYKANGLSIQWYTPSFGGGLPAYPNPQQIQFSLPQALTFLTNPWNASMISMVFFALVGYFAMYLFLSRDLSLRRQAAVLGGLFFTLTGFYIEHMTVGHMGFQVYPLLAVIGLILFTPLLPEIISASLIALLFTLMVNQAGFFPIIISMLALLIATPILFLRFPEKINLKRIARILLSGFVFTVFLTGSKIFAVFSFMRLFPRAISDTYATSPILGLFGISLQLLGAMNLVPLLKLVGMDPNLLPNYMLSVTRAMFGYWEFDMSMPPVAVGIIFMGTYGILRNPKKYARYFLAGKKVVALLFLLFFTWLTVEMILAKGLIYPFLARLPILSSLHVNPRFTATFLFPLALAAAIIYDGKTVHWSERKSILSFLALNILTLVPLCSYFLLNTDFQYRIFDITSSQTVYHSIQSGESATITGIVSGVDNINALLLHDSNLEPYEAIFGYGLADFHPEIHAGSIWDTSGGYFNMTNPTGYVFPEVNGTRPFERIAVSEKDKLEAFADHKQPAWNIPLIQKILDWVSGVSFLSLIIVVILFSTRWLFFRNRTKR